MSGKSVKTAYKRGTYLEYKVKNLLETNGWYCIRSAGSHGLVDIVALKPGKTLLIQCKRSGITKRESQELASLAEYLGATPIVAEISKRRLVLRVVNAELEEAENGKNRESCSAAVQ